MYELSVAFRYLLPRLRELSVSIISLISSLVIALVVWLIIVFFSATEGLEKRWTERLVAITSPIRLTPNNTYYTSYYSQIDLASSQSNYHLKSIQEKLNSKTTDPYDKDADSPLPSHFPSPELTREGKPLDIIKSAVSAISSIPGVTCAPFETAYATTKIRLIRPLVHEPGAFSHEIVTQASYLVNWDKNNPRLAEAIDPLNSKDMVNIHRVLDAEKEVVTDHNPTQYTLQKAPPYVINDQMLGKSSITTPLGDPILLPRSFREAGVLVLDEGTLSYQGATATGLQELRTPVYVAGFYDPGIIPIGGKIILAPPDLVSLIRSASGVDDSLLPTGLNVHFEDMGKASMYKEEIIKKLAAADVLQYFDIQKFDEYEFTKDVFTQLKSERNLFSLISIIIIIVACSNIISMLIILVHDKAKEIAILRALGATKTSIALIFGFAGFLMGAIGSCVGAVAAFFTVRNLPSLLAFLGKLQGFDVLNASFYGEQIPTTVSERSLLFVIIATALISMIAALVPALKASRQNTSEALRSE